MTTMFERLSEETVVSPRHSDRSIGAILLEAGKLKPGDAERALKLQREKGLRFGEACIALKLVSQADIDAALSRQFDYPYLIAGEGNLSEELVAAYRPFSKQVESLRALRTQLLLRWFNDERRMLAIVSPSRGDGRTYLAANLAIVFSQLGERTLLVDADMRGGRQHDIFGLPSQFGLSAVLGGRVDGRAIERISHFENLSVLPAGGLPPNPSELLSRPEFKEFAAAEADRYDVILLDTPPGDASSDAQAIAARAGGALMVARENHSRLEAISRLTGAVHSAGAEVIGCVLNRH